MFSAKLNRDKSDKVFISVQNVDAATITTGYPVGYQLVNSNDGVNAVKATTSGTTAPGFVGVAVRDIAVNDYGLVQIAGFVNSILLSNVGTSLTVNAGDPMVPAAAGFFSGAPTYANSGFRWVFLSNAPVAISASAYGSGIIRMV